MIKKRVMSLMPPQKTEVKDNESKIGEEMSETSLYTRIKTDPTLSSKLLKGADRFMCWGDIYFANVINLIEPEKVETQMTSTVVKQMLNPPKKQVRHEPFNAGMTLSQALPLLDPLRDQCM